ncbi:MAG: hypothetical protein IRD7MM_02755 [Candidatus Midichloria mitochondrii]
MISKHFKTFWSPERDSETILSVRIFELYIIMWNIPRCSVRRIKFVLDIAKAR